MICRASLTLFAGFALGSCTAAEVVVKAGVEGGRLVFRAGAGETRADCFNYFLVLDAQGKAVWRLTSDYVSGPAEACPRAFPLRYGAEVKGVQTEVAAAPLVRGQTYAIDGKAIGRMIGAFRIGEDGRVENVDPRSAEADRSRDIYDHEHTVPLNLSELNPEYNATAN